MPRVYEGVHPDSKKSRANNSVPPGHRTKCRKCGCLDNVCTVGPGRRLVRCGACGGKVARRRAPKAPKVISYVVVTRHDDVDLPMVTRSDRFAAEQVALCFVNRGPVARTRIAQVVELLDGVKTGNFCTLRYDNYKQREAIVQWSTGCETCKGRGAIAIRMPAPSAASLAYTSDSTVVPTSGMKDKPTVRFIACTDCNGLGGQLSREVNYGRHFASMKG